jgi:ribosomal protein L31E
VSGMVFNFTSTIWMYHGKAAWFFITIPKDISDLIKFHTSHMKTGWGSVRIKAKINQTSWKTSLFPDSKSAAYLLPVKAEIRKKAKIQEGDDVAIEIEVLI